MTTLPNNLILEAQADFGLNLLRETVNNKTASMVLSPLSVAIALSMAYAGAQNETEAELNKLIANGQPKDQLHSFFGSLIQQIMAANKSYTLDTANRIYLQQGFDILDAYKQVLNEHYQGQFEVVDFKQAGQTAKTINDFVEKATHEKIKDLIDAGSFSAATRMILVNAVYFKGSWATKFEPKATQTKPFYVAEGNEKQVEMMRKSAEFIYHENAVAQILGLPYQGNDVFMFIVLPKERYGLDNVLKDLTGKKLLELLGKRHKTEVSVSLPKFKLESMHELTPMLQKLGLQNALSQQANFNGISNSTGLQISDVVQKAFIEVNEEGTEAAAATGIQLRMMAMPTEPVEFLADHPFFYAITTQKGDVLFNGVVKENH